MPHIDIVRHQQQLDELIAKVENAVGMDLELQAHWAQYLCVLICGYIEVSVRVTLTDYAGRQAGPKVVSFVTNELKTFQNPKMEHVLKLIRAFSPGWEEQIRLSTSGAPKEAVDSIVINRHKIAHGESSPISLSRVKEYYRNAKIVVEQLRALCASN
jgi:hypothetical protein